MWGFMRHRFEQLRKSRSSLGPKPISVMTGQLAAPADQALTVAGSIPASTA